MFKKMKIPAAILTLTSIYFAFSFTVAQAEQVRIAGETRYETAVKIAQQGWKTAETVVLAQGMDFPDALASVPLAHKYNAPILLTRPDVLPAETSQEITRLGAKQVIILGGTIAVSKSIEDYLVGTLNVSVRRIGGETRFQTAEAVAAEMGDYNQVFIVNGYNFPDALSIAPYAAITGSPILITGPDNLTVEGKQAALKAQRRVVIGGSLAVGDNVQSELNAERIAGINRYDTSLKILNYFYKALPQFYFATGEGFADALAGSTLAAKNQSGIILVPPNFIPNALLSTLKNYQVSNSFILGGNLSVSALTSATLEKQVIYAIKDRSKPIIFYIPHSDDELLAAGAGINYYVENGFDVYVALMTKGMASVVYNRLKLDFPNLTLEQFGDARVQEFKDSLSRLGVKETNMYVYDFPDSGLTAEDVKSVILQFESKFPNAEHRGLSFKEVNPDHRAIGIALNDLYWSGKVKNARFYIAPYPDNRAIDGFYVAPSDKDKILDAISAYKLYLPEQGRYAIGYQSVPQMFEGLVKEPISKAHMPDQNYMSILDENEEIVK